jgi:hypothetical protein
MLNVTPPRPPSNALWAAETPHNIAVPRKQTALLKRYLKQHTHSPPSPTEKSPWPDCQGVRYGDVKRCAAWKRKRDATN